MLPATKCKNQMFSESTFEGQKYEFSFKCIHELYNIIGMTI